MTDWHGCYNDSWKGLIVDKAFQHPAKFARGLIERIVEHGLEKHYWKPGDLIGDPFAGIGCGGILCASRGLRWLGVELEERFVKLANDNFALHYTTWQTFGDPQPEIIHGDSRRFAEIVGEVCGVVTSPPFCHIVATQDPNFLTPGEQGKRNPSKSNLADYGTTPGQIGSLPAGELDGAISSPPYAEQMTDESGNRIDYSQAREGGKKRTKAREAFGKSFGGTDGQIGSLPAGQLDGAITSPPYAESVQGKHEQQETAQESREKRQTPGGPLGQSQRHGGYGVSDGQIGSLKEGSLDGAVTSPPYEGDVIHARPSKMAVELHDGRQCATGLGEYGKTEGQIGHKAGETYWQAMSAVYCQMWLAMKPGGVAAIVLKDYVKVGKRVPLCDDTCKLLESVGFEVFERTRCWLVEETVEPGLFGEDVVRTKSRKSFFRRLAEKRGSPRIDWEEILWTRKPN